jgi:hypothetical protein
LKPEVCGVVGLSAEDLHVGVVGGQCVDFLDGLHGGVAAGDRLIAERAVQRHVLGEQAGEGVLVDAAVDAVDEGRGARRRWSWLLLVVGEIRLVRRGRQLAAK